jgi:hypothetical protein
MMSLASCLPLGPQKAPPNNEVRNSADLVDQLAFFAGVLLFIPHHAMFRFPPRVDSRRKTPEQEGLLHE